MRLHITTALSLVLLAACAQTDKEETSDTKVDQSSTYEADLNDSHVLSTARQERKSLAVAAPSFLSERIPSPLPSVVNTEQYEDVDANPIKLAAVEPISTFSSDVDTASYSVMRSYLQNSNQLPPSNSVRVEEMINYFDYDYKKPKSANKPFEPTVWVTPSPWRDGAKLMHIGVKGFELQTDKEPDSNIVLLLDVSGSMSNPNKLPLVKKSVELMLNQMDGNDTISIVVYAGAAGVVLEPTKASEKTKIKQALNNLSAGGSTAGGEGLSLAYSLAEENFAEDKVNRIILATDGDFNVGTVDANTLEDYVARKRDSGIYLTVLGFGRGNYNDIIAQKLAQSGNGVAAYIDNLDEARKVLVREFNSTVFPIAKDLKFQVEFNPATVAEYRLIGYETRKLNKEDFNNDAIDAGDIGSGHTVTAIYEFTTVGSKARLIDDLRYKNQPTPKGDKSEYAFVKLRYKLPEEDKSNLVTQVVKVSDEYNSLSKAPKDARFAASVAAFGQKLKRSGHAENYSYGEIIDLAQKSKGKDEYGLRAQFIQLLRNAEQIENESATAE